MGIRRVTRIELKCKTLMERNAVLYILFSRAEPEYQARVYHLSLSISGEIHFTSIIYFAFGRKCS